MFQQRTAFIALTVQKSYKQVKATFRTRHQYYHSASGRTTSANGSFWSRAGSPLLALSLGLWGSSSKSDESAEYSSSYNFMAEPISGEVNEMLRNKTVKKSNMKSQFELFCMQVQTEFCRALEELEAKYTDEIDETKVATFQVDRWLRPEGGGGITCILQDGSVFEKAGVNISVVHGQLPPAAIGQMRSRGKNLPDNTSLPFFAAGVSSVIHPRNPNIPTIHFNYRYFEVEVPNQTNPEGPPEVQWWFGGGVDMTPYILHEGDCRTFHKLLKGACDRHDAGYYPRFKKWCDEYFYVKHRGESRYVGLVKQHFNKRQSTNLYICFPSGIGGLFFDDIDQPSPSKVFNFVQDCAHTLVPSYVPIVDRHARTGYSLADRQWQLVRRGRYVEFNLIYDRGTKFGLMTPGARYESILMSLPLTARWEYQHQVERDSKEAALLELLKNPKEWV